MLLIGVKPSKIQEKLLHIFLNNGIQQARALRVGMLSILVCYHLRTETARSLFVVSKVGLDILGSYAHVMVTLNTFKVLC